jgi:hypothetical protein
MMDDSNVEVTLNDLVQEILADKEESLKDLNPSGMLRAVDDIFEQVNEEKPVVDSTEIEEVKYAIITKINEILYEHYGIALSSNAICSLNSAGIGRALGSVSMLLESREDILVSMVRAFIKDSYGDRITSEIVSNELGRLQTYVNYTFEDYLEEVTRADSLGEDIDDDILILSLTTKVNNPVLLKYLLLYGVEDAEDKIYNQIKIY